MIGRNIGNYVVLEKVGEGGMGAVYLAEHPLIGRQVAVKVLHPHLARHQSVVARFFTEARSAYEVRSANIVEILDFGMLEDKTTYFIMEWLDGQTLAGELQRRGRLPVERAVHVTIGIGRALLAAHARGVVHRDLKPDNVILVEREGDPDFAKVLDFGIAKLMDEEEIGAPAMRGSVVMGTPAYMSPEQCAGDLSKIDSRSDLYALGVILFQMVTGRTPFGAQPITDVIRRHLVEPPPAPSSLAPRLHPVLERVILRALEKDPARRYQTADEIIEELQQASPRRSTQELTHRMRAIDVDEAGDPTGTELEVGHTLLGDSSTSHSMPTLPAIAEITVPLPVPQHTLPPMVVPTVPVPASAIEGPARAGAAGSSQAARATDPDRTPTTLGGSTGEVARAASPAAAPRRFGPATLAVAVALGFGGGVLSSRFGGGAVPAGSAFEAAIVAPAPRARPPRPVQPTVPLPSDGGDAAP